MNEDPRITIEAIFDNDDLKTPPIQAFQFAPDGNRVAFLQPRSDSASELSIWLLDLATKEIHEWITDIQSSPQTVSSSKHEKDERERKRQFALGINEYFWHPDNKTIIIPSSGQVFSIDTEVDGEFKWEPLTDPSIKVTGSQLSPQGSYVSFVSDNNLCIQSTDGSKLNSITFDREPLVTNGLPDFLAAEEMHRFKGHWWSPDEKQIVFCRVDERPVDESFRLEIDRDVTTQVTQRYPYSGEVNPIVELVLYEIEKKESELIWSSLETDNYLARVSFSAYGLFIIEQSRSQKRISINQHIPSTNTWKNLYTEKSEHWINLTDDLHIIAEEEFVYSTETRGTRQPIHIQKNGAQLLPQAPTHVNQILGVKQNQLYAMGWDVSPTENHLFEINLDGGPWRQITENSGWHNCHLDLKNDQVIVSFSNTSTLPITRLHSLGSFNKSIIVRDEQITPSHPYHRFHKTHSKPILGEFKTEGDTALHYRLTPPKVINGRHPVITYVYGGPGAQKVKNEWAPYLLQLFAEEGFAVLEIDNRGSTNRGIQFESAIHHKMGQAEVRDQTLGIEVLEEFSWTAANRVGIFGHSYGGYMALMCLTKAGPHFKSGVAVAPVCDWRLYDTHYTERYMGQPNENKEGYLEGNVLTHLSKLEGSLLLMHGMADDNVLFTHSSMLINELQKLDKKFELMVYPGSKHSMQEKHVSKHRFRMILDFFQRTL